MLALLAVLLLSLISTVSSYGLMVAPDIDQKRRTRMHPYSDEYRGYGMTGYGGGYYDNYAYSPRRLGWGEREDPYYSNSGYGVYNNYYNNNNNNNINNRRLGWTRDSYGYGGYDDGYYNRYYGPTTRGTTQRRLGGAGYGGGYGSSTTGYGYGGNRRLGWDRDNYGYGYNNYNNVGGGYGSNYYYNPSSAYGYGNTYGPSKYSYNERTGTFGYNDYDNQHYNNYY
ncbi:hypothetical protein ACA910_020349 [Epithemia clementina (nom. ined.)]